LEIAYVTSFHSAIVDKIKGLIGTPQFVLRRLAFSRLQLAQTNESQCRTIEDMAMTLTQHVWNHCWHFTQPNEGRLMFSPLSVCLSAKLLRKSFTHFGGFEKGVA